MKGYRHLTQRDRYLIEDLLSLGKTKAAIARELGVDRSSVCREVKRNSNQKGGYKARGAQQYAKDRQTNFVDCKRKISGLLQEVVMEKLEARWSPAQISGRLKKEGRWSISHQSIYTWIYMVGPGPGMLRGRGRRRRGGRKYSRPFPGKDKRKNIEERPWQANERTELGHWERDLLEGKRGQSALLVLTDRKSRFTKLVRTKNKLCAKVAELTRDALKGLKFESMTNDNGVEFGEPIKQEEILGKPVFYTDPYSSWQRGTVENTNGLLRDFFPKSCSLNEKTNEDLSTAENMLNDRPRRSLGYRTAREEHFGLSQALIDSNYELRKRMNERSDEGFKQCLVMAGVALDP
jgi:IS30 family transposase